MFLHEGIRSVVLPLQKPHFLGTAYYLAVHENCGTELFSLFVQVFNFESHSSYQLLQPAVFLRPKEFARHFGTVIVSTVYFDFPVSHGRMRGNWATTFSY